MSDRPFPVAQIQSTGPQARFLVKDIPPPTAFYVDEKDTLAVIVRAFTAAETISIRTRLLRMDGKIVDHQQKHLVTGQYLQDIFTIPLTEGFLLSCLIGQDSGIEDPGNTYATVVITRGGSAISNWAHLLTAGYVTSITPLSWPTSPPHHPLEGPGMLRTVASLDPVAGAEISETVPDRAIWRPIAWTATLVTNATAANRRVNLLFDTGVTVYHRLRAQIDQTASQTTLYSASNPGAGNDTPNVFAPLMGTMELRLREGHRIRTLTEALQAGDNWGAALLLVEQWTTG